jgi:peptidoglycan hydrolase CwlO-like protein
MTDKQVTELIDTLTKIANELSELNKNVSYLQSSKCLTVGEVRQIKEPRALYHE